MLIRRKSSEPSDFASSVCMFGGDCYQRSPSAWGSKYAVPSPAVYTPGADGGCVAFAPGGLVCFGGYDFYSPTTPYLEIFAFNPITGFGSLVQSLSARPAMQIDFPQSNRIFYTVPRGNASGSGFYECDFSGAGVSSLVYSSGTLSNMNGAIVNPTATHILAYGFSLGVADTVRVYTRNPSSATLVSTFNFGATYPNMTIRSLSMSTIPLSDGSFPIAITAKSTASSSSSIYVYRYASGVVGSQITTLNTANHNLNAMFDNRGRLISFSSVSGVIVYSISPSGTVSSSLTTSAVAGDFRNLSYDPGSQKLFLAGGFGGGAGVYRLDDSLANMSASATGTLSKRVFSVDYLQKLGWKRNTYKSFAINIA